MKSEGSVRTPSLSVVVPSVNGEWALFPTLEALSLQVGGLAIEVIVVDRLGADLQRRVLERFPSVRVLPTDAGTTIPEMRHLAFEAARGSTVAVIEDHVLVPRDWALRLQAAQGGRDVVIGGSVENAATETLVDWAAFLCEYSHCIPPIPAGAVSWLTGNNVAYPAQVLASARAVTASGAWENVLHDTLRSRGVKLECHPDIVVGHKMHYSVGDYLSQRYLYARSYAGARVDGAGLPRRLAMGLAAMALPPLLLWRTVSRILPKTPYRPLLLKSLPLIGLFVVAWAAGEVVGYVGGPGDSLGKVK